MALINVEFLLKIAFKNKPTKELHINKNFQNRLTTAFGGKTSTKAT